MIKAIQQSAKDRGWRERRGAKGDMQAEMWLALEPIVARYAGQWSDDELLGFALGEARYIFEGYLDLRRRATGWSP